MWRLWTGSMVSGFAPAYYRWFTGSNFTSYLACLVIHDTVVDMEQTLHDSQYWMATPKYLASDQHAFGWAHHVIYGRYFIQSSRIHISKDKPIRMIALHSGFLEMWKTELHMDLIPISWGDPGNTEKYTPVMVTCNILHKLDWLSRVYHLVRNHKLSMRRSCQGHRTL